MAVSPRHPSRLAASDELDLALHHHYEEYAKLSRTAVSKLLLVWHELEVPDGDQLAEIAAIGAKAVDVWTNAVQKAEDRKHELMQSINAAIDEVHKIQQQLGDSDTFEFAGLDVSPVNFNTTLRIVHGDVLARLEVWRAKRDQRTKEYDALQGRVNALKHQLGIQILSVSVKPDISKANMEFLEVELSKLQAERVKKAGQLQDLLTKLDDVCIELGEDARDAAASVHSSLRLCMVMVQDGQAVNPTEVSLSPTTFHGVEEQILAKVTLKDEREGVLATYMDLLCTLWEQLTVEEENTDRAALIDLVDGPKRLHQSTLDKCAEETTKLEKTQAQVMRDLIATKIKELQELCHVTHIPAPEIEDFIEDRQQNPGQIRDVLVKVISMLTEAGLLAEKRGHVIGLIDEMEEARAESNWLKEYEGDANRFKGREANRNLQRSLKAAKMREKMGLLSSTIREALLEWRLTEGHPFLYDEKDYLTEVLDSIDDEIQQLQAEKANKGRKPTAATSSGAGRPGSATPSRPGTASSMSSGLMRTPSKGAGSIKIAGPPSAAKRLPSGTTKSSASSATPSRSRMSLAPSAPEESVSNTTHTAHAAPAAHAAPLTPKRHAFSKASRQGTFELLSPRSPAPQRLASLTYSCVESCNPAQSDNSVQNSESFLDHDSGYRGKVHTMRRNENSWDMYGDHNAVTPRVSPSKVPIGGNRVAEVYRLPAPLGDVTGGFQNAR